jgi:hypothetical protein
MPAKGANAKKEGKGKGKDKDDKGRGGRKEQHLGATGRSACEVYVEGHLEKFCEGNLLRKWQTRYCVLTSKGLSYFKSKDELVAKKEPGTLIPVADFRNCAVNGLEIMLHAQSRTLVFRAGESQALPAPALPSAPLGVRAMPSSRVKNTVTGKLHTARAVGSFRKNTKLTAEGDRSSACNLERLIRERRSRIRPRTSRFTACGRAGDDAECEEWVMYIHEKIAENRSSGAVLVIFSHCCFNHHLIGCCALLLARSSVASCPLPSCCSLSSSIMPVASENCFSDTISPIPRVPPVPGTDFGSCGIGDDDTRFWAETVKPVALGGILQDFALCKVFKDTEEWDQVLALFSKSMPCESLVRCMRLQHKRLLEEHRLFRQSLQRDLARDLEASVSKAVSTRKVFHGASSGVFSNFQICLNSTRCSPRPPLPCTHTEPFQS